ncbi:MAG: hypothetical protein CMJ49_06795, partial [Planctomycetaceae bacterium]|nr:hypothetical protein [Planctomycetaceae bacterium]
ANAPGDFQNRPDLILPGESPGFFLPDGIESFLLDVDEVWDIQPRWVSIEIEVGIDPQSSIGGEALITGIDFEAECIPLPSAAPMGLAMLGGIGLVRRRRVRG